MVPMFFNSLLHILSFNIEFLTYKSYKMVDNNSKTSFIRHIQKNVSLMKINATILVLCTHTILVSSFVTYFFCICHSGSIPIVHSIGVGTGGGGGAATIKLGGGYLSPPPPPPPPPHAKRTKLQF